MRAQKRPGGAGRAPFARRGEAKGKGKKEKSVFDLIAPVYALFYRMQKKKYHALLDALKPDLDLSGHGSVLDVGCGTGALCAVLHERGHEVTGIDPARRMLDVARRKAENVGIDFLVGDVLEGLPFKDKSFDIAIASFVAHGLKEGDRAVMYREMARVSRHHVLFYDYNEKRSLFTDFLEWLEGGDYFNFIRTARREMESHFQAVRLVEASSFGRWYLCTPFPTED